LATLINKFLTALISRAYICRLENISFTTSVFNFYITKKNSVFSFLITKKNYHRSGLLGAELVLVEDNLIVALSPPRHQQHTQAICRAGHHPSRNQGRI
jgi:hypothetical protein